MIDHQVSVAEHPDVATHGVRRRRGWLRPLLYAAGLLLLALIAWRLLATHHAPAPHATAPAQPVGVATVTTGDLPVMLSGLGTVTPLATITVQTQINGELMAVGFKEGQIVQRGAFLAQIDPRPYQSALEQAQGTLAHDTGLLHQAVSDLARYVALKKQGSIALQQVADQQFLVEQDKGTVLADQGAVDTARVNLAYTRIVAPVTGRVGLRLVDPGNYVQTTSSTGLVVLTQLQPISVIFVLAEDDLGEVWQQLRAGHTLSVSAYNRSNSTLLATGTLASVDNEVDTTTGTVKLRADFANADQALFPNQFVNARLLVSTASHATIAPVAAIQHGAPGTFVYLVGPDKKASVRVVKTGISDADRVQITSGLQPGDSVVVDGADRLRDGSKVRVMPDPSDPAATTAKPAPRAGRQARSQAGTMNPSRLFIMRPVGTTLLMVALLLLGIVAFGFLPISALPQVDYPTIQVSTFYPGASPQVMTTAVTAPLERQFGEMPGLDQMSSSSSAGASVITLQFNLDLSLDVAEQEVQAAINAATSLLPTGLPAPPVYAKVNPADTPVISLAITSKTLSLTQIEDLADVRIAQKLSQLSGVGLVSIAGGERPAVQIQVNPRALAAFGIAIDDIRTDITNENTDLPKGNFDGPSQDSTINNNDQLQSAEEYRRLIVGYKNNGAIRLSDVASVIDGAENPELAAWANRQPAIIINIQRQPGSNVIAVAGEVKALLPKLALSLPAAVDVRILSDQTTNIRASVNDVEFELGLSVLLVVLVIFVFLRNLPATLIPSLSVPLSLVGTLAGMYLFGFSLDNLSLMSLTIATGFVVDDAIVMIENIARYVEAGETPLNAALRGSREIGFTIISLTVSLIAVLIPLLFMGDVVGRLFHEFAITLATTIILSAVVSLTLVPMLCALLVRHRPESRRQRFDLAAERGFNWIIGQYDRALGWVLEHQPLTLIVATLTLLLTVAQYIEIPKGFFPEQDTGAIQGISYAAQDISFAAMARKQQALADLILSDPDVVNLSSFIGVDGTNATLNSGRLLISLKPFGQGRASAEAIIARLNQKMMTLPGISVALQPVQDLTIDSTTGRAQYLFFLENPNGGQFTAWLPRLVQRLQQNPLLQDVSSDLAQHGRQLQMTIDRSTAARFGITPATIDNALYDAFGERIASTLYTQSNQYRVILNAKLTDLRTLRDALEGLYLPSSTATSGQVPLSAIVQVSETDGPLQIDHLGQFPSTSISFNIAPGASLDKVVAAIGQAEQDIGLPASFSTAYQGALSAFQSSLGNELLLIIAAVVAVYIVLGVLYESFFHPLTILSTLPSAGVGALLALRIAGDDLDIIGIIGIILLIGIVKKNAIMIIDFALEAERVEGKSPRDSIRQACLLRFRPILMTTLAAMFGALPLMLATGAGSELRRPLGLCIVGGLLASQVLTLFTTPVIYLAVDRVGQRLMPLRTRRGGAASTGPAPAE